MNDVGLNKYDGQLLHDKRFRKTAISEFNIGDLHNKSINSVLPIT